MNDGDPIKPDSTQNQGNATANAASGIEGINPIPRAGDVVINKADHATHKTGETNKPTQPSQQDILDRIRAGELWMIVFTAVVALTTVAQFVQSGCNNASTTKQIDRVILAANTQATAAHEISGAAQSFSNTASAAVDEFKKAATNSAKISSQAAHTAKKRCIPRNGLMQRSQVRYST